MFGRALAAFDARGRSPHAHGIGVGLVGAEDATKTVDGTRRSG